MAQGHKIFMLLAPRLADLVITRFRAPAVCGTGFSKPQTDYHNARGVSSDFPEFSGKLLDKAPDKL